MKALFAWAFRAFPACRRTPTHKATHIQSPFAAAAPRLSRLGLAPRRSKEGPTPFAISKDPIETTGGQSRLAPRPLQDQTHDTCAAVFGMKTNILGWKRPVNSAEQGFLSELKRGACGVFGPGRPAARFVVLACGVATEAQNEWAVGFCLGALASMGVLDRHLRSFRQAFECALLHAA